MNDEAATGCVWIIIFVIIAMIIGFGIGWMVFDNPPPPTPECQCYCIEEQP